MALVDVRKEMSDTSNHIYHKFYVVLGRKPEPIKSEGSSDRTVTRPLSGGGSGGGSSVSERGDLDMNSG